MAHLAYCVNKNGRKTPFIIIIIIIIIMTRDEAKQVNSTQITHWLPIITQ